MSQAYKNPVSYTANSSGVTNTVEKFNTVLQEYLWGKSIDPIDIQNSSTDDIFKRIFPMFRRKKLGVMMKLEITNQDIQSGWYSNFTLQCNKYYSRETPVESMAPQSSNMLFMSVNLNPNTNASDTSSTGIQGNPITTNDKKCRDTLEGLVAENFQVTSDAGGRVLYVRLYPQAGAIIPPIKPFSTMLLSNNEILQVSSVVNNNILCSLQNCIALNTLDTQWADLYTLFFDYWINSAHNRSFTLIFGDYEISNCYLRSSPQIPQTLDPVTFFNLDIISGDRSIHDIGLT